MSLGTSTPIRVTAEADAALKALQKQTHVNKSSLLRLAITAGLPVIMQQFGLSPSPARKTAARRKTKEAA